MYVAYVGSKRKENMDNRYCSDNDHEQLRLFLLRPISLDFADSLTLSIYILVSPDHDFHLYDTGIFSHFCLKFSPFPLVLADVFNYVSYL